MRHNANASHSIKFKFNLPLFHKSLKRIAVRKGNFGQSVLPSLRDFDGPTNKEPTPSLANEKEEEEEEEATLPNVQQTSNAAVKRLSEPKRKEANGQELVAPLRCDEASFPIQEAKSELKPIQASASECRVTRVPKSCVQFLFDWKRNPSIQFRYAYLKVDNYAI